jgi:hypothetical protein
MMDHSALWRVISVKRFRRQLDLDVEHCSPIALRDIVLNVHTPAPILDRIAQAYVDDEDLLRDLVVCPNLSRTTLAFITLVSSEEMRGYIAGTRVMQVIAGEGIATGGDDDEKTLNLSQLVQRMKVPQKIKLALAGNKEARGMLIHEANKMVSVAVMENPRLTIGEVEFFSKSANLCEEVLRKIGTNPEWTKKYTVIAGLVSNPKTPVGISLNFINRLTDRDLGLLERSRDVPAPVRTTARQWVAKKKMGRS